MKASSTAVFTGVIQVVHRIEVGLYVVAAEVLLYGVYLVLFGFYLHVLYSRKMANHRFLTLATVALFILSTVHCALQLASITLNNRGLSQEIYADLSSGSDNWDYLLYASVNQAANAVYVMSNVIADSVFAFRCYAVWNFRPKVIIFPLLLIVAVAGLGCANFVLQFQDQAHSTISEVDPSSVSLIIYGGMDDYDTFFFDLSIGLSVLTTFVLMGLTAGRIWSTARSAQQIMGKKMANKSYTACAMILESGALYCAGGIPFFIITMYSTTNTGVSYYLGSGAVLGQLVGIAPTIIAVRVGLGRSVENVESFLSDQTRVRSPLDFNDPTAAAVSFGQQIQSLHADAGRRDEFKTQEV
ncbi:hypothetical protein C8R44DRAFT_986879 [Mycena epipterygia]|nr:hypothetical protein C8R44DRAFT_986879 [Mycena epipterygia]